MRPLSNRSRMLHSESANGLRHRRRPEVLPSRASVAPWDAVLTWISHHQGVSRVRNRMRAPEAVGKRVRRSCRVALSETLNSSGRAVSERINALIVVARDKSDSAPNNKFSHDLLVDRLYFLLSVNI